MTPFSHKHLLRLGLSALLSVGAMAVSQQAEAQISFGGTPTPLEASAQQHIPSYRVKVPFLADDLRASAQWQQQQQGTPLIVGRAIEAHYSLSRDAQRCEHPTQDVRLLSLSASGAQALSLGFSRFHLAPGAKLYIYTPDHARILGAFTRESNPPGGIFATQTLPGGCVVLQYEAPQGTPEPIVEVDHVGYMYDMPSAEAALPPNISGEEGSSGLCQVNVNCPEGNETRQQQDAVVQILTKIGSAYALCTGTILNNTKRDFKPYVITAAHCAIPLTKEASADDLKEWVFTFHYERPYCHNNHSVKHLSYSITGAKKLTILDKQGKSDGLLLELLQPIPAYYGAYYAGWDRSGEPFSKAHGLHHPKGDVMKIATVTKAPEDWTWSTSGFTSDRNAHWKMRFEATANGHSVTEGGSSGSGLFNQDGLLVATLTGGSAECDKNINGSNMYGKLSYHWAKYKTATQGEFDMASWLDPVGGGTATKLEGAYQYAPNTLRSMPLQNLRAEYLTTAATPSVKLSWQRPTALPEGDWKVYITNELDQPVATLDAATTDSYILSNPTSQGGIATYKVCYGVLPQGAQQPITYAQSMVSLLLAEPAGASHVRTQVEGGDVVVSWQPPVQRQGISQCLAQGGDIKAWDSFDYPTNGYPVNHLYLGCRYNGSMFAALPEARISAMGLVAARSYKGHQYSLYVRNGVNYSKDTHGDYSVASDNSSTTVEQPISATYSAGQKILIPLATPFRPNAEEMLVAGVKMSSNLGYSNGVVMADAKAPKSRTTHNVLSFDTRYWMPAAYGFSKGTGAFTFDIVLDNASEKAPVDLSGSIPVGIYPAPFLKVKGYKIVKNGQEVATLSDAQATSYRVAGASAADDINVYPIYEDGRIAMAVAPVVREHAVRPMAYPTQFTSQLHLSHAQEIAALELISLSGEVLGYWVAPQSSLEVGEVPQGSFLLRFTLQDGAVYTQQLMH